LKFLTEFAAGCRNLQIGALEKRSPIRVDTATCNVLSDRLRGHPAAFRAGANPTGQSDFLQRFDIDHRDVIRMFIGHVGRLVVGVITSQPALPAKSGCPQELQVRTELSVEVLFSLLDQAAFSDPREHNAVKTEGSSMAVLLFGGYVWKLDLIDFRLRCEIENRKSIQSAILSEDPLGRAVRD